ncbi:MAG TPA: M1 family aminopeptidase [Rubricoccaceae bacterium]|nr:M1 family aminopeptidase [Rubricoccaceae bacterium]
MFATIAACRPAPPSHPPEGVDVERYTVHLRLDPATLRLSGRVRLDVRHPAGLAALPLALDDAMEVRAVRVNGRTVSITHRDGTLSVPLDGDTLSAVEVVYRGVPEEGVYRAEAAGQTVVYTDAWPTRGAGWLPGLHVPSDPAALDLTLDVPPGVEVVASGTPAPAGTPGRFRFHLSADAPTYTFAFAVADFTEVADTSAGGIPIRHHLLEPDKAPLLARTAAVLDTLQELLGPYPYVSYGTVQVPMEFAGMENAAMPFLRADLYTVYDGQNAVEEINIHEAVHQWFGNDVVPADWRELWLAEGFATYLSTVVYERLDGPEIAQRQRVLMTQLSLRDAQRPLVPARYRHPSEVLTATAYGKGGSVLHLLRLRVGDAAFFRAVRRLAQEWADRPLTTTTVKFTFEAESGEDLAPFFRYWVYGRPIPTLPTTWDAEARRLRWHVEGDEGTLARLPFELLIRQGGTERAVSALAGEAVLPGPERPEVEPVGVLLRVR